MEEYTQEQVELAAEWCLKAHKGQVDKAGNPYFMHPFTVATKCKTNKERIVGLLHDVIEDSEVINPIDILNVFGQEIFDAVVAISRGLGETYNDYIERVALNELAKTVKKADLEHNLSNRGFEIPYSLTKRYVEALMILEKEN